MTTGPGQWSTVTVCLLNRLSFCISGKVRMKRVLCDTLGSERACAAYCVYLGKIGGKCSQGICYCFRDATTESQKTAIP